MWQSLERVQNIHVKLHVHTHTHTQTHTNTQVTMNVAVKRSSRLLRNVEVPGSYLCEATDNVGYGLLSSGKYKLVNCKINMNPPKTAMYSHNLGKY